MPAYSTANDPIMQRYIALLNSNPALASQIDERANAIYRDMSGRGLYDRSARRIQTPEGGGAEGSYREYPLATALRQATEELAPIGQPAQPTSATATAPAATFADVERGAANVERMAREREMSMTGAPKEPPSGMRDFRKQRLIDAGVGGLLRETATGMSDDQLLERMMMDQLEIGEKAKKVSMQNAPYEEQGPPAPVFNLKKSTDYEEQGPPTFMQQGRDVDIIGMDEEARTADKVRGLPTLRRDIADPNMADDTVTASYDQGEIDLEGMAPSQQTLLQRIGNALKDNPELAASGAQLLGGLLSNVAQNRAQRRADRTNRERTGRANLIAALTGGRVRPDVERAQADTGGFMSLDTLGKALQGGGAAYKGELARQVEEAERERRADLDERQMALREGQAESLAAYRAAKAAEGSGPPKISAGIEKTIRQFDGSIKVIDRFIDQLENYDKEDPKDQTDTIQRAYQGLVTRIPVLGSYVNPKAQQYTDQRSMLVGEVAKIINGGSGQVSNFDLELAEQVVPDIRNPRDTGEFGMQKLGNLRKLLELRRSAYAEGYSGSVYEDAAALVRGEEEGDEGAVEYTVDDFSADEKSIVRQALAGDEDAMRQVMDNPRLRAYMGE